MKKILSTTIVLGLIFISLSSKAQSNKCATMTILNERIEKDPAILLRMQQSEIETQKWISANRSAKKTQVLVSIPVVVHVLYNNPTQNISTAQIQSQIDILNDDFGLFNSDSLDNSHPFWQYTADTEIEFCLATRDPNGNATSGITRTYTDSLSFIGDGNEKYTATGGEDNWDPTKYLNIWVCDLSASGGTLGYAAFPSDLVSDPDEDGVVINYTAFGDIGTATAPNDLGRTGTHEVGHWLNLSHIWGDTICGDDFVADTEIAEDANYGCPTFPHNANSTCGSGVNGEMYMNYMDYVDDYCMVMFTFDQGTRMQSALNGDRAGLLTSLGCSSPSTINEVLLENTFNIYPNPSNGNFIINAQLTKNENVSITLYNLVGAKIQQFDNVNNYPFLMSLNDLPNGSYFIKFNSGNNTITKKVFVSK
jgi:hypothetical protein